MKKIKQSRFFQLPVLIGALLLGVFLQRSGLIDGMLFYWEDIVYLTKQHIQLTVISGTLAIVVGIPLGILLSRPRFIKISEWAMQGLNIGTTIPTLAILALSMSLLGIGFLPSVFGLFIASLLPIVRNTYTGLLGVPAHLKESASGIGMSPGQMLLSVEVPNAAYVIFAGIRTALAINVGTVPLAFLIGGGGLGELIFTGIDLFDTEMMLAGALMTALLAITVDILVAACTYLMVPRGVNPSRA
ncbi:ABC transporter permease [Marinobacter alexandrii]|jgi:osmoprotectant transport system permease protein|uniref:ABC transporter permease n=1 Tax=Marinobacter alexandrii TaxID=2570351 RepID=UPI001108378D|nr:ABC transporter permease [Marinobacter alexandrii]MCK2149326.1 ABC transporter permease [Marinobacter alexandrii]